MKTLREIWIQAQIHSIRDSANGIKSVLNKRDISREDFFTAVNIANTFAILNKGAVIKKYLIDESTYSRWVNELGAPSQVRRKAILQDIVDAAGKKIETLQGQASSLEHTPQ